jgi:hypothetical protein
MKSQTYQQDFLRWAEEQSALFRAGNIADLDLENIFEEIEDMGKEQKLALQSLFRNILVHLLKLDLSPASDPRPTWIEEVTEFRDQAQTRIDETPSLKHYSDELFAKAWQQARRAAGKSFEAYGEDVFIPAECPYSLAQVLNSDYFPENAKKFIHGHK